MAHIRLTRNWGYVLTKLETLPDYQGPSYASIQCYIVEVSVRKHDTIAKVWRYQSGIYQVTNYTYIMELNTL